MDNNYKKSSNIGWIVILILIALAFLLLIKILYGDNARELTIDSSEAQTELKLNSITSTSEKKTSTTSTARQTTRQTSKSTTRATTSETAPTEEELKTKTERIIKSLESSFVDYAEVQYEIEGDKVIFYATLINEAAAGIKLMPLLYRNKNVQDIWNDIENQVLEESTRLFEEERLDHKLIVRDANNANRIYLEVENGQLHYSEMDALEGR